MEIYHFFCVDADYNLVEFKSFTSKTEAYTYHRERYDKELNAIKGNNEEVFETHIEVDNSYIYWTNETNEVFAYTMYITNTNLNLTVE